MFRSAHIKLTTWYLTIIMVISIFFSLFIYHLLTNELDRGFRRFSMRVNQEQLINQRFFPRSELLESEYLELAKKRIGWTLVYVNLFILGLSGVAGYFLAGRTLKPIKTMLDEQNRFIADASHELRTPLTALKTSMEVHLRDKKRSLKNSDELIKNGLLEVNNLKLLSDRLITLAQYQKDEGNKLDEIISLKNAIKDACNKITPLAKEKQIKIENKSTDFYVKGDYKNFVEILIIFLDNAVKYSGAKSKVSILTTIKGNAVNIVIKDNGIGISEKNLPHIFDRFYRVDAARSKQNADGYGLGLSIAKRLIEIYKGSVEVKSKLSKGTVFSIAFPSVKED